MAMTRFAVRVTAIIWGAALLFIVSVSFIETQTGSAQAGEQIYTSYVVGCPGCHDSEIAPATERMYRLAETVRVSDPALRDMTPEQYLAVSIFAPHEYIVPGYPDLMPALYGERLTFAQVADLIAFLRAKVN